MTYKSEGSLLSSYLCKVKVPAKVANDNFKDETFRQAARELIDVQDIPAISKLKLSYSGQEAGLSKAAYRKAMVNGLKNLRGRQLNDSQPITSSLPVPSLVGTRMVTRRLLDLLHPDQSCSKELIGYPI